MYSPASADASAAADCVASKKPSNASCAMSEWRRPLFANCNSRTLGASVPNHFQLGAKRWLPPLEYKTCTPFPWKMLSGIDVIELDPPM